MHARTDTTDPHDDLPLLREWAGRLGTPLTERQVSLFAIYREELLTWNAHRTNLTAITRPDMVESRLFIGSLVCAVALPQVSQQRLIDIGSGGGFPGLPLAIALPTWDITLVEATSKKVEFLEHVIALLHLDNASALQSRAENLAHDHTHRERYDVATARALAPLSTLVELCLPFVRNGGILIAPKSTDAEREAQEASRALAVLGGEVQDITRPPSGTPIPASHSLVIIRKVAPTPHRYPRRNGVPARQPL